MPTNNSINLSAAGLARYDGAGVFTGVTVTNHSLLIGAASNGITSLALTNGQLAIGSTGNDPSAATLTAGTGVSITNGSGSITVATTSQAGAFVLIQSQTASASANLSFVTNTNLYTSYYYTFAGVLPASAGASLRMQMSANGGSTWTNTGYQSGAILNAYNSATISNINSSTDFILSGTIRGTGANETANGNGFIHNCNVAALPYLIGQSSYFDNGATVDANASVCARGGANGANAFRFLMSTGNITSGVISLYGVKTS